MLNEDYLPARSNSPVVATSSRIWRSIFSPELVLTAAEFGKKLHKKTYVPVGVQRYGNGYFP